MKTIVTDRCSTKYKKYVLAFLQDGKIEYRTFDVRRTRDYFSSTCRGAVRRRKPLYAINIYPKKLSGIN